MKKYICQFKKIDPSKNYHVGVRTIRTIKLLRDVTGCGLKQAKNVVDGKLALMNEQDVLDFIRLHCQAHGTGLPEFGLEYTVIFDSPSRVPFEEPTGYCFVVHDEQ